LADRIEAWRNTIVRNIRLLSAIAAFVFGAGFLGALHYQGLVSRMAEWQFSRLGFYLPTATVLSFVALFILISGIVRAVHRQRTAARGTAPWPLELIRLQTGTIALAALTGLCAVMALLGIIHWVQLPSDGEGPTVSLAAVDRLVEGPVTVTGLRPVGPIARYREGVVRIGPVQFLAPVSRRRIAGTNSYAYDMFVEVEDISRLPQIPSSQTGVLRRVALPHEIAAMYRGIGQPVSSDAVVLYQSAWTGARATRFFIVQTLILGALSLLFTVLVRRAFRRRLTEFRTPPA